MPSFLHRRQSYDEKTLLALEQARRDIGEVLKGHDPYRDWDNEPALKQVLAEKLMDLADSGVTDRQELRSATIAIVDFKLWHLRACHGSQFSSPMETASKIAAQRPKMPRVNSFAITPFDTGVNQRPIPPLRGL